MADAFFDNAYYKQNETDGNDIKPALCAHNIQSAQENKKSVTNWKRAASLVLITPDGRWDDILFYLTKWDCRILWMASK